jgi:hypothetical protein
MKQENGYQRWQVWLLMAALMLATLLVAGRGQAQVLVVDKSEGNSPYEVYSNWLGYQDLGVAATYVGTNTGGVINQTNSDATTLLLVLGYYAPGTYNLNGGSLNAAMEEVGGFASGSFFQSPGTKNTVNDLFIAPNSNGNGYYQLDGGSLSAEEVEIIGYYGTGTFQQNGGTNTAPAL